MVNSKKKKTIRFYHGGVKGLKVGDKILPPWITGKSTLLQHAQEIDPNGPQRDDKVYITTDKEAAKLFASVYPNGDVYQVIPGEDIEPDPDCLVPGLSYQCSVATVKMVVVKDVSFKIERLLETKEG